MARRDLDTIRRGSERGERREGLEERVRKKGERRKKGKGGMRKSERERREGRGCWTCTWKKKY